MYDGLAESSPKKKVLTTQHSTMITFPDHKKDGDADKDENVRIFDKKNVDYFLR